jgi:magnesium transporter
METQSSSFNAIHQALEDGTLLHVKKMLSDSLHPGEIANLLESLPTPKRLILWELINQDITGDVLVEVNDEVRATLIQTTQTEELIQAFENLETDDLADIIQDLPATVSEQVLQSMDKQNRVRLEEVLLYPEDSAGGMMNIDTITVRADVSLDVVQRYLRLLKGSIPKHTDSLVVVNREDHYLGILTFSNILTSHPDVTVAETMSHDVDAIDVNMSSHDVASRFEQRDLTTAPVIDETGALLGRITIDDVVDVIREEGEQTLMNMAGLDQETDMFAPVFTSAKKRSAWLAVNLITALLASWVIGLFEQTLDKFVALAILMPVVTSMGGIAGSQTLTIVIRGLALGQLNDANTRIFLYKELGIGLVNGLIWSIVVGLIAVAWFEINQVGILIAIAIAINLLGAALSGVIIPIVMQRMGIDPALAGSVVLTAITDIVGFMAFLGLATLYLI